MYPYKVLMFSPLGSRTWGVNPSTPGGGDASMRARDPLRGAFGNPSNDLELSLAKR